MMKKWAKKKGEDMTAEEMKAKILAAKEKASANWGKSKKETGEGEGKPKSLSSRFGGQ